MAKRDEEKHVAFLAEAMEWIADGTRIMAKADALGLELNFNINKVNVAVGQGHWVATWNVKQIIASSEGVQVLSK